MRTPIALFALCAKLCAALDDLSQRANLALDLEASEFDAKNQKGQPDAFLGVLPLKQAAHEAIFKALNANQMFTDRARVPFQKAFVRHNPKTSTKFDGWKDAYLGSDTAYGELLHTMYTLIGNNYTHVDHFVSVVGSFTALHYLSVVEPKAITLFDMNPKAVQWAQMQVELIKMSKTPEELITRLFCRDVAEFEKKKRAKLTYLNQEEFMSQPKSQKIGDDNKAKLSKESREAYTEIMEVFQDGQKHHNDWKTNGPLLPCENRCFLTEHTPSQLGSQPHAKKDGVSSFLYGEGYLSNQRTFDRVKRILSTVPIEFRSGIDFPNTDPKDIVTVGSGRGRGLLFTMNMFRGFAHQLTPEKIYAWKDRIGKDGLVLLQTTTDRRNLVLELNPKSSRDNPEWISRADWNSKQFLPTHVCLNGRKPHFEDCRSIDEPTPGVKELVETMSPSCGRTCIKAEDLPDEESMAFSILSLHSSVTAPKKVIPCGNAQSSVMSMVPLFMSLYSAFSN